MIPVPDLLHAKPRVKADDRHLLELLEMAFLGRNEGREIDLAVAQTPPLDSSWTPDFFADDLFIDDFLRRLSVIPVGENSYPMHTPFLKRVLSLPPTDLETIHLRQGILRELESDPEILESMEDLYRQLVYLLDLFKTAHTQTLLDTATHRIDTLRQVLSVIHQMDEAFASSTSGLHRLHETSRRIQKTHEFDKLTALLDHEDNLARIDLQVRIGADGRIRNLEIKDFEANRENRFYRAPMWRWLDLLKLRYEGLSSNSREMVNRLIHKVYLEIAPSLSTLMQVLGHLEVYLMSRAFAKLVVDHGLEVCLAEMVEDGRLVIEQLFNPLLLSQGDPPVPCDVAPGCDDAVVVVTGPNSGGKTRLLQALGLAQLLGQSGLYTPARSARIRIAYGTFASLVHQDAADLSEGRLGTELIRIRTLFQGVGGRSLILLDELCSGTNPSEAAEIVAIVLRLARKLTPVAFITTHFLDLARHLEDAPPIDRLEFLQVEIDGNEQSTYQFIPGVATTSLALGTANRLGVSFERLSAVIDERLAEERIPGAASGLPERR
jgi:DNA mismatch repair protein MutS2